jgi:hypothetical protein
MAQGTQMHSKHKLLNPQTVAQKMRTSAVMAFVSRGIGQLARADQCAAEARVLAGQLIEDKSYDAAEAFIALSGYFPLHDHRNSMYLGIAHNITKSLPVRTVDVQRLYNFSLIGCTVMDGTMDTITKRRILKLHGPTLLAQIKEPSPHDILLTAMTKFYCNLSPSLVDALSFDKLATLNDIRLSKEEADVIMADVVIMEYLISQQPTGRAFRFLIKIAKILTCWLSGDTERALREADSAVEWDAFDGVQYLSAATMMIEVPVGFWALVLFYTRIGQLDRAEKMYNMFATVAKLYGQSDIVAALPTPASMAAALLASGSASPRPITPTLVEENFSPADITMLANCYKQESGDNLPDSHSAIINVPYIASSPLSPQMPEPLYNISDIQMAPCSQNDTTPPQDAFIDEVNFISIPGILPNPTPTRGKGDEDYSFLEELLLV